MIRLAIYIVDWEWILAPCGI